MWAMILKLYAPVYLYGPWFVFTEIMPNAITYKIHEIDQAPKKHTVPWDTLGYITPPISFCCFLHTHVHVHVYT